MRVALRPGAATSAARSSPRRASIAAGLALLATGVVLIGWPALTGLWYARSQAGLRHELRGPPPSPETSRAWGRILVPSIGVDAVVVGTTGESDLRGGPGHYPSTAAPGTGLVAIAGHRTTWGAPFRNLDRLRAGEQVDVLWGGRTFHYSVTATPISVRATDWSVLQGTGQELVLTTCDPPGSAARRLVVRAELVSV